MAKVASGVFAQAHAGGSLAAPAPAPASAPRPAGSAREIPVVDMGLLREGGEAGRKDFVQKVGAALEEIGFFALEGHGVSAEAIDEAYAQGQEFFRRSAEEKAKFAASANGGQRGYTPFGNEHAKDSAQPDLKEVRALAPVERRSARRRHAPAGWRGRRASEVLASACAPLAQGADFQHRAACALRLCARARVRLGVAPHVRAPTVLADGPEQRPQGPPARELLPRKRVA